MNGTDLRSQSLPELFSSLTEQLSHLVRTEVALARAELMANTKQAAVGSGMLGGAAVFGHIALLALVAGAIAGVAVVLPVWASALIVAGGLLLIAGLLALLGRSRLSRGMQPLPLTTGTVRQDIAELKARTSRNGTRPGVPESARPAVPAGPAPPARPAAPSQPAVLTQSAAPAERTVPLERTGPGQRLIPAQRSAPSEELQRSKPAPREPTRSGR